MINRSLEFSIYFQSSRTEQNFWEDRFNGKQNVWTFLAYMLSSMCLVFFGTLFEGSLDFRFFVTE